MINRDKIKIEDKKVFVSKMIENYNNFLNSFYDTLYQMKDKPFQIGDYVQKNSTTGLDTIFNVNSNKIGKIVDFDERKNYYFVRYSNESTHIGLKDTEMHRYTGSLDNVSSEVKDYDPFDFSYNQMRIIMYKE